jgi:Rad3-related DNA helicase
VIDEVLEAFESSRVVMLKGGVGSGKSIIAATVCGAMGRGVINVPVKALQEQYRRDYEGRLSIKLGEAPLKIRVLKGRDNFPCELHRDKGYRCSHRSLLCTMPLSSDTPRWSIAKQCPHWSPIYPGMIRSLLDDVECELVEYGSVTGRQYIYMRSKPCGYYAQNKAYAEADIVVYNNAKWFADTAIGRKPRVAVEVFDEGDLFLDSLSSRTRLTDKTLARLRLEAEEAGRELLKNEKRREASLLKAMAEDAAQGFEKLLEKTRGDAPRELHRGVEDYLRGLIEFLALLGTEFAGNLQMKLESLMRYSRETYFYTEPGAVNFFISKPSAVLQGLMERSAARLLFMSATLQSPEVLEEIYGIQDFAYVEGEPRMRGRVYPRRLGWEVRVNWRSWNKPGFRQGYWRALSRIIEKARRPTLVQVHAYQYLPEEEGYPYLPTQGFAREMDQEENIAMFKVGREELLFSTKTDRGIDLPGNACRSIVLMKYPYPGLKDPFFAVMRGKLGEDAFWSYYHDLAWREFQQQIGRGLRSPEDWVEVWSPDLTVHKKLRALKVKRT